MSKIDRENYEDAKEIIDKFIPDESIKWAVLSFLCNGIDYANSLNTKNWNINLDRNGKFVRFNVGQEYCLEIFQKYLAVIVLRKYVSELSQNKEYNVRFKGLIGKKKIVNSNLDMVPDCLVKVPNSVVCLVQYDHVKQTLPLLKDANWMLIEEANTRTKILPKMKRAHSSGFIVYLSQYFNKWIPSPEYTGSDNKYNAIISNKEQRSYGGGFGNQETNRKVEQAAIRLVSDALQTQGWFVKSVERENCGFDLLCSKDKTQEYVEVKGVQGTELSFIITAGEVQKARTNPNWVLFIVTSALSNPKLQRLSADEFIEKFTLDAISFRASMKTVTSKKQAFPFNLAGESDGPVQP